MSLSISIHFLTGRAHLHPWQTHHSEGKVEWPPSPWRLLRALVSVAGRGLTTLPYPDFACNPGKKPRATKSNPNPPWPSNNFKSLPDDWFGGDEADEVPVSRLAALLSRLASAPEIWLPKTSGGHTRQFFTIHSAGMVKNSGSAVFDTFAVVQKDQPLVFHWPEVDFSNDSESQRDLRILLHRMTYFGRAESWCKAELYLTSPEDVPGVSLGKSHWKCLCVEEGGKPEGIEYRDYTLERRLTALSLQSDARADECELLPSEVARLLPETKNTMTGRKQSANLAAILQHEATRRSELLLLRCLLRESGQDMKDGLDRPIGTRWIHYAVPRAVYDLPRPKPLRPRSKKRAVELVRYAINTATSHRPVLPPLTDTVLVADKFRRATLAIHNSLFNGMRHPRNLCGREDDGSICRDSSHAFFWPTDENNDGFLDHISVYCPAGLQEDELDTLRRLTRLKQRGGRPDLLITPLFFGAADDFPDWRAADRDGSSRKTKWFLSATPYFCPLHLSHGRSKSGRLRPLTPVIYEGLRRQSLITTDEDIESIQELVFDYDPNELQATKEAIAASSLVEPVPPRQYFSVISSPSDFPPLPLRADLEAKRFPGVFLKAPDAGFPFGASLGLYVADGTRFVRALAFVRRRKSHRVKGYGRMLAIRFREPRSPRPFAIGDQSHFGLGLFTPITGPSDVNKSGSNTT